jgi:lipopolysaccharide export system protein LptA
MGRLGERRAAALALGAAMIVGGAAAATAAPAPAGSQAARGGSTPAFGSSNAPIEISADEAEYLDQQNKAIWRGNVEVTQGTSRLRTPQLTMFYTPRGGGAPAATGAFGGSQIQRMEADGPVYYVTPTQNARGDHAVYEAGPHTITLTGDVVLVQDKNVVQGDRLVIDTDTNHSQLFSNNQGRGQKRVRGVFYPQQQGQQQGAAAPAAAPAARP